MRHPAFSCVVLVYLLTGASADTVHDAGPLSEERRGDDQLVTAPLQSLIDSAADSGGGVVRFPAGEYRTGALRLRSNVGLRLEHGAVLIGSDRLEDYGGQPALIYAKGETGCSIEGPGRINGQGEAFWKGKSRPYRRPDRFLLFEDCKNVRLSGVRLEDSPNWTIEARFCDGVWIDGVSIINSLDSPNSDGIDPVSSRNVFISNCYISTGDDAICPKSLRPHPCENIVVSNCVLESDDAAIKLGTRSEAPIRHVIVSDCVIRNSSYGIALFAKDGGTFEHLRFKNMTIESTRESRPTKDRSKDTYPIFVDLEQRDNAPLGTIHDVHFDGITIDTVEGQCAFLGQPDRPIENIRLTDLSFTIHERRSRERTRKPRGVRHLKDLAANDFTSAPSSFVFAHLDGLTLDRLRIDDRSTTRDHGRHALWVQDSTRVSISSIEHLERTPSGIGPSIILKRSSAAEVAHH